MRIGYYLEDYKQYSLKVPLDITLPKKTSNILIAGKSGSGKSTSLLWYIANALRGNESLIYLADYKGGEEYEVFEGVSSYASGENAIEMINQFYELFSYVRTNRIRLKFHITLVIEEWFGLLVYAETKSKKMKTDLMSKVGELLAVSRGLNMGLIICVQRADATLFTSGAREQFQCVCSFGRTSSEQFKMLGFSGELDENPTSNYKTGQALVLIDNQSGVQEVIVPYVTNAESMKKLIQEKLSLQSDLPTMIRTFSEGKRSEH